MSIIGHSPPKIKSTASCSQSSQTLRRIAREFVAALAAGHIAHAPAAVITPDCEHEAVVVAHTLDSPVPVRSPWLRARLAHWIDVEIVGRQDRQLRATKSGYGQWTIDRQAVDAVVEWIVVDAWLTGTLPAGEVANG